MTKEEVRMHSRAARRLAEVALTAIGQVESKVQKGDAADFAMRRFLHHHRELGGRDRRFIAGLVFSYFRWLGWINRIFDNHLAASCFLCHQLDAEVPHPAAHAIAEMAGILPSTVPLLGQAPIAEKCHALEIIAEGITSPTVSDLVPSWLPDTLYIPPGTQTEGFFGHFVESCQIRPPVWMRLAIGYEDACLDELAQLGLEVTRHSKLRNSVSVKGTFQIGRIHAARRGELEIQDLASQCVGLICAPRPGESWWDICAGSGGKTLHLADLMQDKGHIRSTDIRPGILKQFSRRVHKTRFTCISSELITDCDETIVEAFDGVLLDAPCSGIGTWSRNPDARWRTSSDQVEQHAEKQRTLLERAAKAVRPGGRLVYSVCTVTRAETIDVVNEFIKSHANFHLEPSVHPLTDTPTNGEVWIWPWEGACDGMYVSVISRNR